MWCIPPKQSAEFVCHVEPAQTAQAVSQGSPDMEDVLDVYCRPVDPQRPVVCLDECSKQLVGEVRHPPSSRPGQAERFDCEYVRHGTANLLLQNRNGLRWAFEPLGGWCEVEVTDRRQRGDWAHFVRHWADGRYRDADRIVLVMDPSRKRFAFRGVQHPFRNDFARSLPKQHLHVQYWHLANDRVPHVSSFGVAALL